MHENEKMAKQLSKDFSDKQAVKKQQSRQYDHELANEPLSMEEKLNNKKTKKDNEKDG
nr:small acid-soluble spore protein O [Bacillus kwashiorkori]